MFLWIIFFCHGNRKSIRYLYIATVNFLKKVNGHDMHRGHKSLGEICETILSFCTKSVISICTRSFCITAYAMSKWASAITLCKLDKNKKGLLLDFLCCYFILTLCTISRCLQLKEPYCIFLWNEEIKTVTRCDILLCNITVGIVLVWISKYHVTGKIWKNVKLKNNRSQ